MGSQGEDASLSASPFSASDSPPGIAVATEEVSNKRSSIQPLLLQSVDWLEDELLSSIIDNNEEPSAATASKETCSLDDGNIRNESAMHASLVSRVLSGEAVGPNSNIEAGIHEDVGKVMDGLFEEFHGDDGNIDPMTRLPEERNRVAAELASSNASKDDTTSGAAVSHSPSISANDSP